MRGHQTVVVLAIALVSFSDDGFGQGGVPHLIRVAGQEPELDLLVQVVQGEAMYVEFDYPVEERVRLGKNVFFSKKINLSEGTILRRRTFAKGAEAYCSTRQAKQIGGSERLWVCLADRDGLNEFDTFAVTDGKKLSYRWLKKMPISPPVPFTVETAPAAEDEATEWVGDFYRYEIVYQGAAGGVLRLLYREFVNSLAREAFNQELTYDLAPDGPTTISVRKARLEILEAGNDGVRYRVLRGFRDSGE